MKKQNLILIIMGLFLLSGNLYAKNYKYKDFIISDSVETDHWTIIQYNGSDAEVIIPEKINKVEVVRIAEKAFYENLTIESVEIPLSVKTIDEEAFADCSALKTVKGNISEITVAPSAFLNTPYKTELESEITEKEKSAKPAVKSAEEKFNKYMKLAAESEEKNLLVFAMNYYYEAILAAVESEEKEKAQEAFDRIANQISEGMPGFGDYNVFQMHDNWKKIILEYEKLWTYYCPWYLIITYPKQQKLNYENRTATYKAKLYIYNTDKYQEITKVIEEGFVKAKRSDWKDMGVFYSYKCRENIRYDPKNLDFSLQIIDDEGHLIISSDNIKSGEGWKSYTGNEIRYFIDNVSMKKMAIMDEQKAKFILKSYKYTYSEFVDGEWVEKEAKLAKKPELYQFNYEEDDDDF